MRSILMTRERVHSFLGEYVADFRTPNYGRERVLDEAETLLSVLLAIALAHLIGAQNIGWAAFSGYMVMRSRLRETMTRGTLRIVGTVVGAIAAWASLRCFGDAPAVFGVLLALTGGGTLYCPITRRRSYAWLFTGLTFAMVVLDTLSEPMESVARLAETRLLEVVAGTVACLMVSAVSSWTLHPRILGFQQPAKPIPTETVTWNRGAARHAALAAAALAVLPFLSGVLAAGALSQASITILALMMIPLSSLGSGPAFVSERARYRFAGCVVGAGLAGLALLIGHHHFALILLFMSVGVIFGRHIENSAKPYAYAGNQLSLVFLVIFVPDSYQTLSIEPGIDRLIGIVTGMIVLGITSAGWHIIGSIGKSA